MSAPVSTVAACPWYHSDTRRHEFHCPAPENFLDWYCSLRDCARLRLTGSRPRTIKAAMSKTPEEIKKIVETEDDFGFEMRVGNVLARMKPDLDSVETTWVDGFAHGETYTDSNTSKPRQFDYRCQIRHCENGQPPSNFKCLFLSVECKNLNESSPLIVCGRPRSQRECTHTIIESTFSIPMNRLLSPEIKTSKSFYPVDRFVGKSLLRLKKDGKHQIRAEADADIYDKWSQVLQSSVELAQSALSLAKYHISKRASSIILPLVVVPNGLLWQVEYDATGSISGLPRKVRNTTFFAGRQLDVPHEGFLMKVVLTHIHFVTVDGIEELLSTFLKRGQAWNNWHEVFK